MKIATLIATAAVLVATVGCDRLGPGPIPDQDGTYRTHAPRCAWSIQGLHPRQDAQTGPATVSLDDTDTRITVRGCGKWTEVNR